MPARNDSTRYYESQRIFKSERIWNGTLARSYQCGKPAVILYKIYIKIWYNLCHITYLMYWCVFVITNIIIVITTLIITSFNILNIQYSECTPLINLIKFQMLPFYLIWPIVWPSDTGFKHRPNNQFVAFNQGCKEFFMKNNVISINEEEIIHPHFSSSIEGFLF